MSNHRFIMRLARGLACGLILLGSLQGQAVDVMFVLETSPGTEQTIGLLNPRDLSESDRAGVIGVTKSAQVLQGLTEIREELTTALRRAGTRVTVGVGGGPNAANSTADVAGAIKAACHELDQKNAGDRKRAIIVFFASEDPSLGIRLDSLQMTLEAAKAQLFAVVIQRVSGPEVGGAPRAGNHPFPVFTAQLLSQLASRSGGRVYKRNWDLQKILAEARKR